MSKSTKCIILANGRFPRHAFPLSLLKEADIVIACDGAVNKLLEHGITPSFIVGDLDSVTDRIKELYPDRIFHNPDQETNDLTKAVKFAAERGFRSISILGATGIREDHTLANISLLTQYHRDFESVDMVTDYGTFRAISRTTRFDSYRKQKISIFSLPPVVPVTVHNLKYPIVNRELSVWWEGSLNESVGDSFDIELHGEGFLIVYAVHRDIR